ncbi:MAG: glutamate mutase L, partial [Holophaga sp.]|nr:glutamate mutase L [Holophaga sp.]
MNQPTPTSTVATAESLLAIDIGTINTRVALFDVVEGAYRFIAAGSAPTTVYAPYRNVTEG